MIANHQNTWEPYYAISERLSLGGGDALLLITQAIADRQHRRPFHRRQLGLYARTVALTQARPQALQAALNDHVKSGFFIRSADTAGDYADTDAGLAESERRFGLLPQVVAPRRKRDFHAVACIDRFEEFVGETKLILQHGDLREVRVGALRFRTAAEAIRHLSDVGVWPRLAPVWWHEKDQPSEALLALVSGTE